MAKKRKCMALAVPDKFAEFDVEAKEYLCAKASEHQDFPRAKFFRESGYTTAGHVLTLAGYVLGVLGVVAFVMMLACAFHVPSHPWFAALMTGIFGCGVPLGMLYGAGVLERRYFFEHHDARPRLGSPTTYIPSYLRGRLEDVKQEIVGDKSDFGVTMSAARETLQSAKTLCERFAHHCRNADTSPEALEFLKPGLEESGRMVDEAMAQVDLLESYQAKVLACFAEAEAEINGLSVPLVQYELMAELAVMKREVAALKDRAAGVVMRATLKLAGRMNELRETFGRELDGAGIRLALAAAQTGDIEQDIKAMDKVVGTFVRAAEKIPLRQLPASSDD